MDRSGELRGDCGNSSIMMGLESGEESRRGRKGWRGVAMEFKEVSKEASVEVGEGGKATTDSRTGSMKGWEVVEEDKIEDKAAVDKDDSGESTRSMTKGKGEGMGFSNVIGGGGSTNGLGKEGGEDEESSGWKGRPGGMCDRRESDKNGGGSGTKSRGVIAGIRGEEKRGREVVSQRGEKGRMRRVCGGIKMMERKRGKEEMVRRASIEMRGVRAVRRGQRGDMGPGGERREGGRGEKGCRGDRGGGGGSV